MGCAVDADVVLVTRPGCVGVYVDAARVVSRGAGVSDVPRFGVGWLPVALLLAAVGPVAVAVQICVGAA